MFESSSPPTGSTITSETAAKIMGDNFHGFDSTARYFGRMLSKEKLSKLRRTSRNIPFSEEVLRARCDTHVLFFGLPGSLWDVWGAQPNRLHYSTYLLGEDSLCIDFKTEGGWLLVRKDPVPDSYDKTWKEQIVLLGSRERVPSAPEIAQAIIVHYMKTGKWPFDGAHVRILDVDSDGQHVYLESSRRHGLKIHCMWDDDSYPGLGLASCIRGSN